MVTKGGKKEGKIELHLTTVLKEGTLLTMNDCLSNGIGCQNVTHCQGF